MDPEPGVDANLVRQGAVDHPRDHSPTSRPTDAGERERLGDHLDRFGGGNDPVLLAKNLASYAGACGASFVVLPTPASARTRRWALDGQWTEDNIGPERTELLLRQLEKAGLSAWFELRFEGPLPGLPVPEAPEALQQGLVLVDRQGRAEPASCATTLAEVGGASLIYSYRLTRGETLIATGHTKLACVDDAQRLAKMPKDMRDVLLRPEAAG